MILLNRCLVFKSSFLQLANKQLHIMKLLTTDIYLELRQCLQYVVHVQMLLSLLFYFFQFQFFIQLSYTLEQSLLIRTFGSLRIVEQ